MDQVGFEFDKTRPDLKNKIDIISISNLDSQIFKMDSFESKWAGLDHDQSGPFAAILLLPAILRMIIAITVHRLSKLRCLNYTGAVADSIPWRRYCRLSLGRRRAGGGDRHLRQTPSASQVFY